MQAFWQMFERELTSLFEGDMQGVQAVLDNLEGSYLEIRECWENMATFAGDPMVDD